MNIRAIDRIEFGIDINDYRHAIKPFLLELKEKKEQGQELGFEQRVHYGNTQFEVGLTGIRFYAYKIKCKDFFLAFAEIITHENPHIKVVLYSGFLWSYGYEEALYKFFEWFKVFPGEIKKTRLSRIDICLDTDEIEFYKTDEELFKTRAKVKTDHTDRQDSHKHGKKYTGISIGSGVPMLLRIYNKSVEIKKKGKEWFFPIWRDSGWDMKKEVWRIEYQIRRTALKELGIDSLDDLKEKIEPLWKYLTTKWAYMDDPRWETVLKTNKPYIHPLTREKVIKGDLKRIISQINGLLISVGAYKKAYSLKEVFEIVEVEVFNNCMSKKKSFNSLVKERRSKYFGNAISANKDQEETQAMINERGTVE